MQSYCTLLFICILHKPAHWEPKPNTIPLILTHTHSRLSFATHGHRRQSGSGRRSSSRCTYKTLLNYSIGIVTRDKCNHFPCCNLNDVLQYIIDVLQYSTLPQRHTCTLWRTLRDQINWDGGLFSKHTVATPALLPHTSVLYDSALFSSERRT